MRSSVRGTLQELCTNLAQELKELSATNALRIVGFTGPPGAGKSTAITLLQDLLKNERAKDGQPLIGGIVPMDGFHKSNEVLELEGLRGEKGSPETFDVVGMLMMLDRVHARSIPIYAPGYDRRVHQAIAARHRVDARGLVLTEGNYLGLQDDAWALVREQIDLLIYLDVPQQILLQRLLNRSIEFGKTPEEANHWVRQVDQPNIMRVYSSRGRADRIWQLTDPA